MLRFISILTIIAYSASFIGCGASEDVYTPFTSRCEEELKENSNLRELLAIRDEMIDRALESNVPGVVLAEIVKQNDEARFASILGYTEEEMADLGSRIALLGENVLNKYPDLRDPIDGARVPCQECEFKNIAEKWDNILATDRESIMLGDGENQMIPVPDPSDKGVTCQWIPYAAALVACTVLGLPVLYFACAIVALCNFCSGGWVASLCQQ